MSQRTAARYAAVSDVMISFFERAERQIPAHALFSLLYEYDCSDSELMEMYTKWCEHYRYLK